MELHEKLNNLSLEIKLHERIKKLPLELIWNIMKYILNPQPTELLNDIRSFHFLRDIGLKLYKQKYEIDYISYFTNDLGGYLNEDLPIFKGCVNKFYDTFRRLYQNKNKDKKTILKYFFKYLMNPDRSIELNVLWGLLKPLEREQILHKHYSIELININYN
jgi:hypothetical protein